MLDALPLLVSAFEVDRLFKRTFVNAIPAWELHKFVASKMFHVYDICLALVTFCSREAVPTAKVRDFFDLICLDPIHLLLIMHLSMLCRRVGGGGGGAGHEVGIDCLCWPWGRAFD